MEEKGKESAVVRIDVPPGKVRRSFQDKPQPEVNGDVFDR